MTYNDITFMAARQAAHEPLGGGARTYLTSTQTYEGVSKSFRTESVMK